MLKRRLEHLFLSLLLLSALLGAEERLPYPIDVGEKGVGRILSGTPFESSAIARLMPGFDVGAYTAFFNGDAQSVIRVSRQGVTVMTIAPDGTGSRIADITVTHPGVTVRGARRIGEAFGSIYADAAACRIETVEGNRELLCSDGGNPHLFLRFAYPFVSAPDTLPKAQLDALRVEAIVWDDDA